MTKIKYYNEDIYKIGKILKNHRLRLSLSNSSRQFFIEDRIKKGLLEDGEISEKTLSNIENGYNLPNLITLKYLSVALEVDFIELIREIAPYIPDRKNQF